MTHGIRYVSRFGNLSLSQVRAFFFVKVDRWGMEVAFLSVTSLPPPQVRQKNLECPILPYAVCQVWLWGHLGEFTRLALIHQFIWSE